MRKHLLMIFVNEMAVALGCLTAFYVSDSIPKRLGIMMAMLGVVNILYLYLLSMKKDQTKEQVK